MEAGTVEINDSKKEYKRQKTPPNSQAAINWFEKKYTTVISKRACPSFSAAGASTSHSQAGVAAEFFQLFECPLTTDTDTDRLPLNLQSPEDTTKAESLNTD